MMTKTIIFVVLFLLVIAGLAIFTPVPVAFRDSSIIKEREAQIDTLKADADKARAEAQEAKALATKARERERIAVQRADAWRLQAEALNRRVAELDAERKALAKAGNLKQAVDGLRELGWVQ